MPLWVLIYIQWKSAVLASCGSIVPPSINTFKLLICPFDSIQEDQSEAIAFATRSLSPEKRSSGQYPVAADLPADALSLECMQKRQLRSFVSLVSSERKLGLGRNAHFGYTVMNKISRIHSETQRWLTLISTAHPLPPTRSVARTAFLLLTSISSFAFLLSGRWSFADRDSCVNHSRETGTDSRRGKCCLGINRDVILCWNSIDGSSGSSDSPVSVALSISSRGILRRRRTV